MSQLKINKNIVSSFVLSLKNLHCMPCFKLVLIALLGICCNKQNKITNSQIINNCELINSIPICTDLKTIFGAEWLLYYEKNPLYIIQFEDSALAKFYIPKSSDSINTEIRFLYCTHLIKDINAQYPSKDLTSQAAYSEFGNHGLVVNYIDTSNNRDITLSYIYVNQDSLKLISGAIYFKDFQLIIYVFTHSSETFSVNKLQDFYCFINSFNITKYGISPPDCRPMFKTEREYLNYLYGPNNIYRRKEK